jgi:hypothetical protein
MVRAASKSVRDTADFKAPPAKIQRQPQAQAGRFQSLSPAQCKESSVLPTFSLVTTVHQPPIGDIYPDDNDVVANTDAFRLFN